MTKEISTFEYIGKLINSGNLIVVGGRPSMGKTCFALNVMEKISLKEGRGCLYLSLEESVEKVTERFAHILSGVDLYLPEGPNEDEKNRLADAKDAIKASPVVIDDLNGITIETMEECIREYISTQNIDLIIIDYLQLIGTEEVTSSRSEEIDIIINKLKKLSLEINKHILLLSQLSNSLEKREDRRPGISDLRDSARIGDAADTILFLYRDEYYDKSSNEKGTMEVITAKNNAGNNTSTIKLKFIPSCGKLESIE